MANTQNVISGTVDEFLGLKVVINDITGLLCSPSI
jgi:hypothetical protein